MYLLLMQHAKAKTKEEDPEQGITDEGRDETITTSGYLKTFNFTVEEIWYSTKKRSRETAEIVTASNKLKNKLSVKDFLSPMDEVKPAVKILNTFNKNLMIIGHMPFLSKLTSSLITGSENYEPVKFMNSAIVIFIHENNNWKIVSIITP